MHGFPSEQSRSQSILKIRGLRLLILTLLTSIGVNSSCSRKAGEAREIRAHVSLHQGIAHAEPSARAERYCQECHGANLQGGTTLEPSCYTCHGKNWLDDSATRSYAPADHTLMHKIYKHHPDAFTPETSCTECHGAALQGTAELQADGKLGTGTVPGCELCHAKLWEDPERRAKAGL